MGVVSAPFGSFCACGIEVELFVLTTGSEVALGLFLST